VEEDYLKGIWLKRHYKVSMAAHVFTADQVNWRENIKKLTQNLSDISIQHKIKISKGKVEQCL
jgi:hypothetical protein